MNRKTIGTILGICCAALALANSPTARAEGHKADRESLPIGFTLSIRGQDMSDELVFILLTTTAVNRQQEAAQTDEGLNARKYEDRMAALKAVGIE